MSWSLVAFALSNIDGKVTGAHTIDVGDISSRFYPTAVLIECTTGTVVTVVPTLSVGSNSPTFNDIVPATALTGLTASGKTIGPAFLPTAFTAVAAGGTLGVNITIGATATTCTLKVIVVGAYA